MYPKSTAKITKKPPPRQPKIKTIRPDTNQSSPIVSNSSLIVSKSQISPIVSNSQNQAGVNPVKSDNSKPDSLMDLNTVQPESESEHGGNISEFNSQTALSTKSVLNSQTASHIESVLNSASVLNSQTASNIESVLNSLPKSTVQPQSSSEFVSNVSNNLVDLDRQNSFNSQMSTPDVQFGLSDNNDSQFGSDIGNFDQSDSSNSNSQMFEIENQRGERQQGFLESLFDQSEITPFQPSRHDSNNSFPRVDSSASISSNIGHIDLRDDGDRTREEGHENMDTFMSRYPRIAPNTMRNNYPPQNNPMSHMFNPMQGFNQGSPQMGYNPMYPYPVLFPPNSHPSQPATSTDGSTAASSQSNDFMSPLQSMSQMGSNPGMMGFPFTPYPFPMPTPYMMGNPYMPMGMPPQYGHQGGMQGGMQSGMQGGMQGGMMPPPNIANTNQQIQDNSKASQ